MIYWKIENAFMSCTTDRWQSKNVSGCFDTAFQLKFEPLLKQTSPTHHLSGVGLT